MSAMTTEFGNAYRWNAAFDHVKEVRAKLIEEAEATLPRGTRYELRLSSKELSPDYDGLTQGMCWYRSIAMDEGDNWQEGDIYRDGFRVERRTTP